MVSIAPNRAAATAYAAGHPPPLLHAGDGRWWAAPMDTGPALGLIDGATFPATRLDLPPGFGLLLYTDGAVEGRSGNGRLGVNGLVRVLSDPATDNDLDRLVSAVTALNDGPLTDDLALLLVAANPDGMKPA
jgi:serine phosphatase RsbU (regulator of sigma subunit)